MQTSKREISTVTIRMDSEMKKQAEQLYDDMGLNMTTAITLFTKAVIREGRIPFEIKADPFTSKANQELLQKRAADMDAGAHVTEHELPRNEDE